MPESYSVQAVLSARDKNFKSTMVEADSTLGRLQKTISGGLGFGMLVGAGQAAFSAVLSGLKGVTSGVVSAGSSFDASMSNVGAIAQASAEEMEQLTAKALEMGRKTKFSATESADAMGYMAMAGWKTEEMLDGLPGIMALAAAGNTDLATTSDIVTDALTAFGKSAAESGRLADIMAAAASNSNTDVNLMGETFKYVAPLAGALGYEMEDTATAIGLMASAGIKGSQAGTSLRSILARMSKGAGECGDAMDALDISLTNDEGKMKSLAEVMGELRSKFAGMTEVQKTQYAAMLAGQEGMSGLLAIINTAPDAYDKLTDAIARSSEGIGAATAMMEKQQDNFQGDVTKMQSAWDVFSVNLWHSVEGPARSVVQTITDMITGADDAVSKSRIGEKIQNIVEKAQPYMDILKDTWDDVSYAITQTKRNLSVAFQVLEAKEGDGGAERLEKFRGAMQRVSEAAENMKNFITDNRNEIAKLVKLLPTIAAGLAGLQTARGVVGALQPITSILGGVTHAGGIAAGALSSGFTLISRGAKTAGGTILDKLGKLKPSNISKGIMGGITKISGGFKSAGLFIDDLGISIADSLTTISPALSGVADAAMDGFGLAGSNIKEWGNLFNSTIGAVVSGGLSKFGALSSGISSKMSVIMKPVAMVGGKVFSLFTKIGSGVLKVGSGIASGLQKMMGLALKALMPAAMVGVILAGLGLVYQAFGTQIDAILNMAAEKGPGIIMGLVTGIASKLPALITAGATMVTHLLDTITANLPAIIAGGIMLVTALVSGVAANAPALITSAVNMISTFVTSIAAGLPALIVTGMQLLLSLVQGIASNLPTIVQSAITAIGSFVKGIIANLPTILMTAVQIIGTLARGILASIPVLVAGIGEAITTMIDTILNTDWIQVGKDIISALGGGLFGELAGLGGKIGEFFGGIADWFNGGKEGGTSVGTGGVAGIEASAPAMVSAASTAGTDTMNALSGSILSGSGTVTSAATDITSIFGDTLTTGFTTSGDGAVDALLSAFTPAADGASQTATDITDAFDTGMADIPANAEDIMSAFGLSIEDGMDTSTMTVDTSMDDILASITGTVSPAGSAGGDIGNAFNTGLSGTQGAISGTVGNITSSVISALRSAAPGAHDAGVNIGTGLAGGMASQLGYVRSVAAQLAEAAEAAIRAKAQIHSPSKVSGRLGGYFAEGWINSILDRVRSSRKAVAELLQIPSIGMPRMQLAGTSMELSEAYSYRSSATYTIHVPVEVDGREVAKATAEYTQDEIDKNSERDSRRRGSR